MARLGGGEFVVVLGRIASADEAEFLARRIIREPSEPVVADDRSISSGATIDVAFAPEDGTDAATVLQTSDDALYSGKRSAKGPVRLSTNRSA